MVKKWVYWCDLEKHSEGRTTEYSNAQNIEVIEEETFDAFKNEISKLRAEDWRKCFQNWFSPMQDLTANKNTGLGLRQKQLSQCQLCEMQTMN